MNTRAASEPRSEAAAIVLAQAAGQIAAVAFDGRSADAALAQAPEALLQPSAVRAITLGCLRWYWQLDALAAALLDGRTLVPTLRALLLAALHQLQHSRNPAPTIVSSAVDAARRLGQPRAAGLINALLRRYLRERDALMARVLAIDTAASAHPRWLLQALQQAWPQHWQQIVDANNEHAPMTLRVDLSRVSREDYQQQLAEQGIEASAVAWLPGALVLARPLAVAELPGFAQGGVSVQDAGAQLAARLLSVSAGQRVLDACAAPGGKSAALLEATDGGIALTALDIDAQRLKRVADTLKRLRRQARLVCADLRRDVSWWDGTRFDRILVDAPCSATGVIRRHPDIRLLRRAEDIGALAQTQQQIVLQCLRLLAPGGRLLYCTCSLLPGENEAVIESVLESVPEARTVPLSVAELPPQHWQALRRGLQLLPGNAAPTDGFYYACLTVT